MGCGVGGTCVWDWAGSICGITDVGGTVCITDWVGLDGSGAVTLTCCLAVGLFTWAGTGRGGSVCPDLKRIPVSLVLAWGTALLGIPVYCGLQVCTGPSIGGLGTG